MIKRNGIALAVMLLSASSAHALTVAAGCDAPSTAAPLRTFYFNPASGDDAAAGTQSAPWKTPSAHSAAAKPGDLWYMGGGNYGVVHIDGSKLTGGFATLKPVAGQVPVFDELSLLGSSHWIVAAGIKVQSQATPDTIYDALVNIGGNSFWGPSDNIIVDSLKISSIDNSSAWLQADWRAKARWNGVSVDGGDANSTYARCVAVNNNVITNVKIPIVLGANDLVADSNTISNYGDDGIDFAGNRILIHNNKLTDNRDIGDANHNDGMQGQIGRGVSGTVYDAVTIDGNDVERQVTPGLAFPGDLQGISAFDMDWSNLKVINNVVITNAYHGISFYSVHGGLIANNTVLGPIAWLGLFDKSHEGTSSNNVVLRNNIVSSISSDSTSPTVTFDHNLSAGQIAWQVNGQPVWNKDPGLYGDNNRIDPNALNVLVKYDPVTPSYDVHLKAGPNYAIGTGNPIAPPLPNGTARPQPVDLGALPYVAGGTPTPTPTPTPVFSVTLTLKGSTNSPSYDGKLTYSPSPTTKTRPPSVPFTIHCLPGATPSAFNCTWSSP